MDLNKNPLLINKNESNTFCKNDKFLYIFIYPLVTLPKLISNNEQKKEPKITQSNIYFYS